MTEFAVSFELPGGEFAPDSFVKEFNVWNGHRSAERKSQLHGVEVAITAKGVVDTGDAVAQTKVVYTGPVNGSGPKVVRAALNDLSGYLKETFGLQERPTFGIS